MLELRLMEECDLPLIEKWLYKEHVRKWYKIAEMHITIDDWISEIKDFQGAYQWITYCIILMDKTPIGLCLYYRCEDSEGENFGTLQMKGSYGIDYLIGEESMLGKGYGRETVMLLIKKIMSFPDAKRVTADIDKSNIASKKTLLSCGFTLLEEEGTRYVYWKYKNRLAPCGLHCGKCFAFSDGDISKLCKELSNNLEGFEPYAKRFSDHIDPVFSNYPQFKHMLEYFANASCNGCREEHCKFYKTCNVRNCTEEKKFSFCYQCEEFPCDHTGFDENLFQRYQRINEKIKESGPEPYYCIIADTPRYK